MKERNNIDKEGVYLSLNRKTKTSQQSTLNKQSTKLFTNNALLLLANRERIMNDNKMRYVPISVNNGLAYFGSFETATLGVYMEWWMSIPYSVLFEENNRMSLIWRISGSPLSGCNLCSTVTEGGNIQTVKVPFFRKLWPQLAKLTADYQATKDIYQVYSLSEVIDILKHETTEEFYNKSIEEFQYQAQIRLSHAELAECKELYRQAKDASSNYQYKWHLALIESRIDAVKSFYDSYVLKVTDMRRRTEILQEDNRQLRAQLRRGELTTREYQPLLIRNNKEIENIRLNVSVFQKDELSNLFPEIVKHGEVDYKEENILAEIIRYFKGTII